jgi:uncharacterized protein (TIGR00730 family)
MLVKGPANPTPQRRTTDIDGEQPVTSAKTTTATTATTATTTTTATTATTPTTALADLKALLEVTGQAPTTSTARTAQPGAIALRDPTATHRAQLRSDLKIAMETLGTLPPALTFFGGARITKSDPYYAISQDIGRLLAERGVPPRTGAGPGIMQSVPEGYVARRTEMEQAGESTGPSRQMRAIEGVAAGASLDDLRTQGFNIKLPHEQKLNAVIEVAKEIQLFPFRKLALYENARGVVTFPGGFGTLDELFEIWNLAATGKLSDPIAAVGVEFWSPMLKALREVAVEQRSLISEADANRLFVSDDPTALLDHMLTSTPAPMGFESQPKQLTATLLKEVDVVTKGLRSLRTAVAFIGGETLKADDPTLEVARALSTHIAGKGAAVRVGDQGTAATTVLAAATTAGADKAHLQEVLWGSTAGSTAETTTTTTTLSERIPHKELFLRSAEAYVVLPAGLKGLDEFATVLCQMQNDKLPMRPLILVGSDYWQPLLDAWKTSMLSGERQLIAPEDMDLVTVVDTVEQAKAALTNLR